MRASHKSQHCHPEDLQLLLHATVVRFYSLSYNVWVLIGVHYLWAFLSYEVFGFLFIYYRDDFCRCREQLLVNLYDASELTSVFVLNVALTYHFWCYNPKLSAHKLSLNVSVFNPWMFTCMTQAGSVEYQKLKLL